MKSFIIASFSLALGFAAAGCKDEKKTTPPPPAPPPATTPATTPVAGGHHDSGPKNDLGSQEAGGYTIKVIQFGTLKPGTEAPFDLTITGGTAKPIAVRAWVGTEAGEGSAKFKATVDGDDYDVHVELPATLPAGSKLWIELETAGGKATASFTLKQ